MISFHNIDCRYYPGNKLEISRWVKNSVSNEKKELGMVSIVFCSNPYLLKINQEYLKHHFYTDIITFDYCIDKTISGDLFISIDQLRKNADDLNIPLNLEVRRVIIHGILHLCGYADKSIANKKLMTAKEDFYLSRF